MRAMNFNLEQIEIACGNQIRSDLIKIQSTSTLNVGWHDLLSQKIA